MQVGPSRCMNLPKARPGSVAIGHCGSETVSTAVPIGRLYQLFSQLISSRGLHPLLDEVLDVAMELQKADFGNIQLYDPNTRSLTIVAHRGFRKNFLKHFRRIDDGSSAYGRAMFTRTRVIIEDVKSDHEFGPHLRAAATAGFRGVQSTPLFNWGGALIGIMSTHFRQPHRPSPRELNLTDICAKIAGELIARKQSEDRMRKSEERLRLMVEGIKDYALCGLNSSGRINYWNKGAERLFGYSPGDVLGAHFSLFYDNDDKEKGVPLEILQLARRNGRFETQGLRFRKDGSSFPASVLITVLQRPDGRGEGFSTLVHDLTEQRRIEQAIETTRADLAHVARLRAISTVAGVISHEINQPLATIQTNADALTSMLRRNQLDLGELKGIVVDIVKAGRKASNSVDRVRALLSKNTSKETDVDIHEVIREILTLVSPVLEDRHIATEVNLGSQCAVVKARKAELRFVVNTLVTNAIEAVSETTGGPRSLFVRSLCGQPGEAVIVVQDSGPGFDPRNSELIFEPLSSSKPHGLGLGLAISRAIVETYGGRLWVTCSPGKSTTFQFSLPLLLRSMCNG